ncbi:MAG TPA: response regulator transcription factor [Solirubrobacterales bacterium]|nr:response regulator transcription factor [Solirubrobacterales bacterium]
MVPPSERPHCLVIDAHPLVRLGVREALAGDFEIHESESRDEALGLVRDVGSIDVAIVDLRRGVVEGDAESLYGEQAIRALRRTAPAMGIVAHGERPERHLASAALQAGASAYVARTASAEEMAKAARAALDQSRFVDPAVPPSGSHGKLTRRQREILQLLSDGGSTTAAARELGLSEETVKTHTKNMLARLGAKNRTHAVAIALRECLID